MLQAMHPKRDELPSLDAGSVTPRPDLTAFPLDDGLVLFSEPTQSLIGLNRAAAFIWSKWQDGVALDDLPAALVAEGFVSAGEAQSWVKTTLAAFGSQGLLTDRQPPMAVMPEVYDRAAEDRATMPPLTPFTPMAEGRYSLLGTHALIRYGHRGQKRMVDTVIGHLASKTDVQSPNLVIDIAAEILDTGHLGSSIYRNGNPERRAKQLSALGPLIKAVLWSEAVNAFDFILDLHAGVVGDGGRCVLLPAAAGSGKSSLTAALTDRGLGYYSDEVALVERTSFRVFPVPLAVCVKSTGWELMSRYFPELPTLSIHRRNDGKRVRYVPPRAGATQKEPARASHIFFPLYSKDEPTSLTHVPRSDALARLMDQCIALRLHLDQGSVKRLVDWIAGIDCYALTFSSLDEAVDLVQRTAFPDHPFAQRAMAEGR